MTYDDEFPDFDEMQEDEEDYRIPHPNPPKKKVTPTQQIQIPVNGDQEALDWYHRTMMSGSTDLGDLYGIENQTMLHRYYAAIGALEDIDPPDEEGSLFPLFSNPSFL